MNAQLLIYAHDSNNILHKSWLKSRKMMHMTDYMMIIRLQCRINLITAITER